MLGPWSVDPPLGYLAVAYVVVSALLYLLGGRSRGTPVGREPLRNLSFFAGLAVIVLARPVMISSTIPSAKYSCSGSPLRFSNGSTAIEALLDDTVALPRDDPGDGTAAAR